MILYFLSLCSNALLVIPNDKALLTKAVSPWLHSRISLANTVPDFFTGIEKSVSDISKSIEKSSPKDL